MFVPHYCYPILVGSVNGYHQIGAQYGGYHRIVDQEEIDGKESEYLQAGWRREYLHDIYYKMIMETQHGDSFLTRRERKNVHHCLSWKFLSPNFFLQIVNIFPSSRFIYIKFSSQSHYGTKEKDF